jgi:hypothetical protein
VTQLLERIAGTASAMRAAQRAYFRTRDSQRLRESRALEDQLDKLVGEWREEQRGVRQQIIFQGEATK